jgi:YD repeat-containing protein
MRLRARVQVILLGMLVWLASAFAAAAQTTTTYEYDAVGRLISAIDSNGRAVVYKYDTAGNRIRVGNESNFAEFSPTAFQASSTAATTGLTIAGMKDQNYTATSSIHITQSEAQAWIRANFAGSIYVDHVCIAPAAGGGVDPSNTNGSILEYSSDNGATWRTSAGVNNLVAGVCGPVVVRASVNAVRLRRTTTGQLAAGDFRFFAGPTDAFTPPIVSGKSLSVTSGGSAPVDLAPTAGGPWTSLAIVTPPSASKGSVVVSGSTATYTAVAGINTVQTDSFTYNATGPGGVSNTGTVNVTINPYVPPPTVSNKSMTVTSGTSANVDLTPSGSWTSIQITSPPAAAKGSVTVNGAIATYKAVDGFGTVQNDSFRYTATGPGGASTEATVNVTINPVAPPVASNKTLRVTSGSSGNVDLTPTGQWNSIQIMVYPSKGTVNVTGGIATYRANTGLNATTDVFTYRAVGNGGASGDARVDITIDPVPAPPSVTDQYKPVGSGTQINIDLTPSGQWTSVYIVGQPDSSKGSVVLNGTQATYTAKAGIYSQTYDSFTYQATGPYGTSNLGTVTLQINPQTAPPTVQNLSGTVTAGGVLRLTAQVSGNWSAIQLQPAPNGSKGSAYIDAGDIVYTARTDVTTTQTDVFGYTASGVGGTSNQGTISVQINPAAQMQPRLSSSSFYRLRNTTGWQVPSPSSVGVNVTNGSGSYQYSWIMVNDGGDTNTVASSPSSASTAWTRNGTFNNGTWTSRWYCHVKDLVTLAEADSDVVVVTIEFDNGS